MKSIISIAILLSAISLTAYSQDQDPCAPNSTRAAELVKNFSAGGAGALAAELEVAKDVCSSFALEAFRIVVDDRNPIWRLQRATEVNSFFAFEAFRKVADNDYKEWELKWAAQVNTEYASKAFDFVSDERYDIKELEYASGIDNTFAFQAFEAIKADGVVEIWELRWAAEVNNPYALECFEMVVDNEYSEWEIRWTSQMDSQRQVNIVRNLRQIGYNEAQLQAVANL